MSYPLLIDPLNIARTRYNVIGAPTSFLIDPQGVIRERIDGPLRQGARGADRALAAVADACGPTSASFLNHTTPIWISLVSAGKRYAIKKSFMRSPAAILTVALRKPIPLRERARGARRDITGVGHSAESRPHERDAHSLHSQQSPLNSFEFSNDDWEHYMRCNIGSVGHRGVARHRSKCQPCSPARLVTMHQASR